MPAFKQRDASDMQQVEYRVVQLADIARCEGYH